MQVTLSETIITIICAIFASGGFWTFVTRLLEKTSKEKKFERQILINIAKEKIIKWGDELINKGDVSLIEFQEFSEYYTYYSGIGGNGGGKEKFEEVKSKVRIH